MTVARTGTPPDHVGVARRPGLLAVSANVVAALIAGAALARWGLLALNPAALDPGAVDPADARLLSPQSAGGLIVIVLGLGLPLLPGVPRIGWLLAAAGVVVAGTSLAGRWDPVLAGVVAGGLLIAGILAAVRWADGRSRTGMVAGLAIGVVAGPGLTGLTVELRRLGGAAPNVDRMLFVTMAGVLAAAGVMVALRQRNGVSTSDDGPAPAQPRPQSSFAQFAIACLAAAVATGLHLVTVVVLREFAYSPSGGTSRGRENALDLLDRIAHTAIAVIAALIVIVYAYRRGGDRPARWVLAGFAMAVPVVAGLPWGLARLVHGWPLAGAAAAGALLGTGLAVMASRFVPWDAFGAIAVAIGLLLTSARGQAELPEAMPVVVPLFAGAMGFTLAAALAIGLAERVRPGIQASPHSAILPGLGLAVMVLGVHLLRPAFGGDVGTDGGMNIAGTVIVGVAATALVSLFGLGRVVAADQAGDGASLHPGSGPGRFVAGTATDSEPVPELSP